MTDTKTYHVATEFDNAATKEIITAAAKFDDSTGAELSVELVDAALVDDMLDFFDSVIRIDDSDDTDAD